MGQKQNKSYLYGAQNAPRMRQMLTKTPIIRTGK